LSGRLLGFVASVAIDSLISIEPGQLE